MKIKIEYIDGCIADLEGDYDVYDTYIACRILTSQGESYKYYDLVLPMNAFVYFEAHE